MQKKKMTFSNFEASQTKYETMNSGLSQSWQQWFLGAKTNQTGNSLNRLPDLIVLKKLAKVYNVCGGMIVGYLGLNMLKKRNKPTIWLFSITIIIDREPDIIRKESGLGLKQSHYCQPKLTIQGYMDSSLNVFNKAVS